MFLVLFYSYSNLINIIGSIFFWNNWLITSISYSIGNILIWIIIWLNLQDPFNIVIAWIMILIIESLYIIIVFNVHKSFRMEFL